MRLLVHPLIKEWSLRQEGPCRETKSLLSGSGRWPLSERRVCVCVSTHLPLCPMFSHTDTHVDADPLITPLYTINTAQKCTYCYV